MSTSVDTHIQVLGGGTPDGGDAILLFFSEHRYIFNCSEGTQRFCTQSSTKLSKLKSIFLTSTERCSGLPGLICTLADSGLTEMDVCGPVSIGYYLAAHRLFLKRRHFTLNVKEHCSSIQSGSWRKVYGDSMILVESINISELKDNSCSMNSCDHHESLCKKQKLFPKQQLLAMFRDPGQVSKDPEDFDYFEAMGDAPKIPHENKLCYRITGPTPNGKFNVKKAEALGIPSGPLRGKLGRGESILLGDGRVIEPKDCFGPPGIPHIFYILDISSSDQIQVLLGEQKLFSSEALAFVYCSSKGIFSEFANAFPHLICKWMVKNINPNIVYSDAAELLGRLSASMPSLFTVPYYECRREDDDGFCNPCDKFYWYGKRLFSSTVDDDDEHHDYTPPLIPQYKAPVRASESNPSVLFLGTAAAMPGKYRNVSSTLVDFGGLSVLFDCGEGTYGQLYRAFSSGLPDLLTRLKVIFISHLHADHHLGLVELLQHIPSGSIIVAPTRYELFLKEISRVHQALRNVSFRFVSAENGNFSLEDDFGSLSVIPTAVIHCNYSFAFTISLNQGPSICYSGDTRPCPQLAKDAYKCNILIHEATFSDDKMEEAIEKKHSTVSEAIQIGLEMESEFILLSHISQRYSKVLPPHQWTIPNVLPVLDFTNVSLQDLRNSKTLVPWIESMQSIMPPQVDNNKESE